MHILIMRKYDGNFGLGKSENTMQHRDATIRSLQGIMPSPHLLKGEAGAPNPTAIKLRE